MVKDIAKTLGLKEEEVQYSFYLHHRNKEIIKECQEGLKEGYYDSYWYFIEDLMLRSRQDQMKLMLESQKKNKRKKKK